MAERDPRLVQGGMGVAVSTWELAKAVALEGKRLNEGVLGVVSGTGLSPIMAFRIRQRDPDTIRVLNRFNPDVAQALISEYTGTLRMPAKPQVLVPQKEEGSGVLIRKTAMAAIAASYVEVALAKEGHDGPIGINLLEKTQLNTLYAILGAMLADVDYVLVGAGIPYQIPGILTNLANKDPATYRADRSDSPTEKIEITLDPKDYVPEGTELNKPKFLLIASQHILPMRLEADGFIIEGPLAGGHNAPARGKMIGEDGQPIYTTKDKVDLVKMAALKKPFWLAGGYASPEKLAEAQKLGATGVQIGSAFALCRESGLKTDLKLRLLEEIREGRLNVKTSPTVSPSGYPFQVVQLEGTLSEGKVFEDRVRICNFGHLVEAYKKDDGDIGFRCPGEPVDDFVKKGGDRSRAETSVCLCNGLVSATQFGGITPRDEPMIVTLGKDTSFVQRLETDSDGMYSAAAVVRYMLGR